MTFDAVVVGGGIVGCACAEALSRDLPKVALVERSPLGGGATAAGMGHIVVMDDSPAQMALTRRSQDLWSELVSELPAEAEFERRGTLWVASDEEEMDALPAKAALYEGLGLAIEILDAKRLGEAEPNLRSGLRGGLLVRNDSVVFPMPVARWLFKRSEERGCERIQATAVHCDGDGVALDSGETVTAGVVINAAGDMAAALTPGLPIQPRKGHLVITDRYPGFINHQLVELGYLRSAHTLGGDSVAFNVQPRAAGQLLIGSSRQFAGWDREVDHKVVGQMLRRAFDYMPGLSGLKAIRTWTGFRAATPDKLPLIGPWLPTPGLWIASGHEGLGITTSLATGELLADLVLGRQPSLDPSPYDPNRSVHAAAH